jgi:phosphatidylserine/phosphatidylglycerophosphate/cardiolipin synthase-like enzyme
MSYRDPLFLSENDQKIGKVASALVDFIESAKVSVHIAIYDFRLKDPATAKKVTEALKSRAAKGVEVRLAYDHRNAPKFGIGDDPAPHGTHDFLSTSFAKTDVQLKPVGWEKVKTESIAGSKLMHSKFVVVDGHSPKGAVWMGSTNFTDDAWTHQENNILIVDSPALSAYYETDFNELWSTGKIAGTGVNDAGTVKTDGIDLDVAFSPGEGRRIDEEIADLILGAKETVHIASMVITSDAIVDALSQVLEAGRVRLTGIVDGPEMHASMAQMTSTDKVGKLKQLLNKALATKSSKAFDPKHPEALHNFMHDKLVVVDDAVLTGSYNFSLSAQHNAENALLIRNAKIADRYRAHVEKIVAKYKTTSKTTAKKPTKKKVSVSANGVGADAE